MNGDSSGRDTSDNDGIFGLGSVGVAVFSDGGMMSEVAAPARPQAAIGEISVSPILPTAGPFHLPPFVNAQTLNGAVTGAAGAGLAGFAADGRLGQHHPIHAPHFDWLTTTLSVQHAASASGQHPGGVSAAVGPQFFDPITLAAAAAQAHAAQQQPQQQQQQQLQQRYQEEKGPQEDSMALYHCRPRPTPGQTLLSLIESYDWPSVSARLAAHPSDARAVLPQLRTALHFACERDAPAHVVASILSAHPAACVAVGTSGMNPLHITCSSPHASVDVVRVLLDGCPDGPRAITGQSDVDGDMPLHAACRCGAPIDVLELLLRSDPDVVHKRDHEGLTPLLRLWVRYMVMLGAEVIDAVRKRDDLTGELAEAWEKTRLLLRVAYHGSLSSLVDDNDRDDDGDAKRGDSRSNATNSKAVSLANPESSPACAPPRRPFYLLHAAAGIDCPRSVVRIAAALHPDHLRLRERNDFGGHGDPPPSRGSCAALRSA